MFKSHDLSRTEHKKLYLIKCIKVFTKIKALAKTRNYELKFEENKDGLQQV